MPLSALQRWVTSFVDDVYRKPSKEITVDSIVENLKKGMPGLSVQVPAYTTLEGEPSKRQYPVLNAVLPIGISKEDPLYKEYYNELMELAQEKAVISKEKKEIQRELQRE